MAFRHGKNAAITVNAKDLTSFCTQGSLKLATDTADTTVFGSTWKTSIAGMASGSLELSGNFDGTATTGPAAVLESLIGAAPFAVLWYPGGNSTGQRSHSFNAILKSYSESSPVADKITFTASLEITGAVTSATI